VEAKDTWSTTPWYVWETYLYRRLVESAKFWESKLDHFASEKKKGLEGVVTQIRARAKIATKLAGKWSAENLRLLLLSDLWGNQADLSLFTGDTMKGKGEALEADKLICDHVAKVFEILERQPISGKGRKVVFFNDNAGLEIVSDLMLVDYFLHSKQVSVVELKLKPYPFFVSDATPEDIVATIAYLKTLDDAYCTKLGSDLEKFIESKRLILTKEAFFTSGDPMWRMPKHLREDLNSTADLVIVKGDLMYRKLLGDHALPPDLPFNDFVSYSPCPLVSLRTCKAPLVIGLQKGLAEELSKRDPNWCVNGLYGVVQVMDRKVRAKEVLETEEGFIVKF